MTLAINQDLREFRDTRKKSVGFKEQLNPVSEERPSIEKIFDKTRQYVLENHFDPTRVSLLNPQANIINDRCQQINTSLGGQVVESTLRFKTQELIGAANAIFKLFGISEILLSEIERPPMKRHRSDTQKRRSRLKDDRTHSDPSLTKGFKFTESTVQEETKQNVVSVCQNLKTLVFPAGNSARRDWNSTVVTKLEKESNELLKKMNLLFEEAKFDQIEKEEEIKGKERREGGLFNRKKATSPLKDLDLEKNIKSILEKHVGKFLIDLKEDLFSDGNIAIFKELDLFPKLKIFINGLKENNQHNSGVVKELDSITNLDSLKRLKERAEYDEFKKILSRLKIGLLELYRWEIWKIAESLNINTPAIAHPKLKLDKLKKVPASQRQTVSHFLKAPFIEIAIQNELDKLADKIFDKYEQQYSNGIFSYEKRKNAYLDRIAGLSSPQTTIFEEWSRALSGKNAIRCQNQQGKILLETPCQGTENGEEVAAAIDAWLLKFEELFSEHVFKDDKTLIDTFCQSASEAFIFSEKPKISDQSGRLQLHSHIFDALDASMKSLLKGKSEDVLRIALQSINALFQAKIQKGGSKIIKTGSDIQKLVRYLFFFYSCFYTEFSLGTLASLTTLYEHFWPKDENGVRRKEGQEARFSPIMVTFMDDGGLTFFWQMSTRFCDGKGILKNDVTIKIPPPVSSEVKPEVSFRFFYDVLNEEKLSPQDKEDIQVRLYRISFLLRTMGFPDYDLFKAQKPEANKKS